MPLEDPLEGKRYDWETEDLLMLPIKAGGVMFQHFNSDPHHPAKLAVAEINWYDALGVDMACGFEQIEDCPEWSAIAAGRGDGSGTGRKR